VHFDTDVLDKREFPAAYFPHEGGMTFAEITEVLRTVMRDDRVRLLEISEYSALRDLEGNYVSKLVDLLGTVLKT
jgi:arginase family enzyme